MGQRQTRLRGKGRFRTLFDRYFPERQLHLRTEGRVSFIRFSRRAQLGIIVVLCAFGGWTGFASVSYFLHDIVLGSKENQIASARLAYRSVLSEVAEYQNRFLDMTRNLEEDHALMLDLVEQNTSLQQNLNSVRSNLTTTESDRKEIVKTRERLKGERSGIQSRMRSLMDRNFALQDTLGTAEFDLSAVLSERNKARSDIDAMRGQIAKLETRLAGIQDSQLDAVERLTNHTVANIDSIEKVVNLTGLDMDRLLRAGASTPEGQGGPFIEVRPDGAVAGHLKARLTNLEGYLGQWEALQNIMRMLPLTAPLDHYYITSRHGKRRDPINKKWTMHYGLDLGSSFKTSVFATSPGTVTYVGWNGRYGRMVEVDHGAGLKTRYGHLHKILVEKGQKLAYREKVGLLGNTGRSTGAHLHYEVLFNARPHDPSKFIGAGRHVFKE